MTYICLFTFSSSGTILITRHNTEHSVSSFIRPQHGNSAEFLVVLCLGRDRRPLERGFVEVGGLTANALSCFSRLNRLIRLCTLCRRDCTMKYNAKLNTPCQKRKSRDNIMTAQITETLTEHSLQQHSALQ